MIGHVCLTALLISGVNAHPEPASEVRPHRVELNVTGDDALRDEVTHGLVRELRQLTGVVITNELPDYRLSVIVMKVVTKSGKSVGLAYSVVVTSSYEHRLEELVHTHVHPESQADFTSVLPGVRKVVSHWIQTGSVQDVPQVCRTIVAAFGDEALGKTGPSSGSRRLGKQ